MHTMEFSNCLNGFFSPKMKPRSFKNVCSSSAFAIVASVAKASSVACVVRNYVVGNFHTSLVALSICSH